MNDRNGPFLGAFALVAIVAIAAYWFLTVYDTAAAKCQRGDLSACIVYEAQQPPPPPPTPTPTPNWPAGPCMVGIDGKDGRAVILDGSCAGFVDQVPGPFGGSWALETQMPAQMYMRLFCEAQTQGYLVQLWDTGGDYAEAACTSLEALGTVTRPSPAAP